MKLKLPSGLRRALLVSCAACSSLLSTTVVSASLLSGLCSFSQAATYDQKEVSLIDGEEAIFSYDYTTHGDEEQVATMTGDTKVSALRVSENTHTRLTSEAAATLTIDGSVLLADGAELILTQNIRFAANTIFTQATEGGTGKLVADFGMTGDNNNVVEVHTLLGGTYDTGVPIEVRSGTLKWIAGKVGANFSSITVTGTGMVHLTGMSNQFISKMYLNPSDTESVALVVGTPGGLGGELYLMNDAAVAVDGNNTIASTVHLQGHKFVKRNTNGNLTISGDIIGEEGGSSIEVMQGTLTLTGNISGTGLQSSTFRIADGATLAITSELSGTGTFNRIEGTGNQKTGILMLGVLSGYNAIDVQNRGQLYLTGDWINTTGDLSIRGDVFFQGNANTPHAFTNTGNLTVESGTLSIGTHESNLVTLAFSNITAKSGATIKLNNGPVTMDGTDITLDGGSLFMFDCTEIDNDHTNYDTFKNLRITSNGGDIEYEWNSGAAFSELTGEGDLTLKRKKNDSNRLEFGKINNYQGTVAFDASSANKSTARFAFYVGGVANSTITIGSQADPITVASNDGFTAEDSTYTLYGSQTVTGDYKQTRGETTISDSLTIGGGMELIGDDTAAALSVDKSLEITGSYIANNAEVEVEGAVTVGGSFTMNGGEFTAESHQVTGSVTLAAGTTAAAGAVYSVAGDAEIGGLFTLTSGTAEITGAHTVGGKFDMIEGTYSSDSLTATGGFRLRDGEFTTGALSAGTEVWVTTGSNSYNIDSITLANETRLRYGEVDAPFITTFRDNLNPEGSLYVYALDSVYFSPERLAQGIDLGISTAISKDDIFAMGYTRDKYELYQQDGTWWLQSDATPDIDPDSTDGIWDANWTGQMPKRPIDDAIPVVRGVATPQIYLSGEAAYSAPTMVGEAVWAQFNSSSIPVGGDIFGGVQNTSATAVSTASWLDVESGDYNLIVGGNSSLKAGGQKADFEGDTHILLGSGATALMVVGGNLQEGVAGDFTGDTYISLMRGAKVRGAVVGGTLFTAEHVEGYTGVPDVVDTSSHIFIYTPLAAETTAGYADNKNINLVVGGNFICAGDPGTRTFTGDSSINILLGGATGTFGKMIVGGDMVGIGIWKAGNSDNHHVTHTGSTSIRITGASGVTFTGAVVGGSFDPHCFDLTLGQGPTNTNGLAVAADAGRAMQQPLSYVYINSGTFRHMVVGGNVTGNFGDTTLKRRTDGLARSAKSYIYGDTQVVLTGGTYYGHSVTSTQVGAGVSYSIGSIAVVGGSHDTNPVEQHGDVVEIHGGTSLMLAGGAYYGHVVGGTVRQAPWADGGKLGTTLVDGGTQLTMLGGRMAKGLTAANGARNIAPRVVGGLLLDMPTALSDGNVSVSVGGTDVTIGGFAEVYDVIGGSWTVLMDAPVVGGSISQGEIDVSLLNYAVVRGDVYAGGIQGGDTPLSAESTKVQIDAGVQFEKWDGSVTIISGGYMKATRDENAGDSGIWTEVQDEFGDAASEVTGTRSLVFRSSESYKNGLSNAWLLNFDDVRLAAGASVEVGALVNGDDAPISLHGAGTLSMTADLITPKNGEQRMNNSDIELTEGATLHLLRSASAKQISYLKGVTASDASNIIIDLAHTNGSNDTMYVENGITMDGGMLTLNINATADMSTRGLIRSGAYAPAAKAANGDTMSLKNGTEVHVHVNVVENSLLDGRAHTLHVVENMDPGSNFTLASDCALNLEKWFNGPVSITLDGTMLNIHGTTVSPTTASYHSRRALTENGRAGARLLDNLYVTQNPEWLDPNGHRAAVLNTLEQMFATGNNAAADNLMAAAGGAGISALGHAFANDLERQMRAIRNRTTGLGLAEGYDYNDLPQVSFWVNAEGDFRKLKQQGTYSGYDFRSWGGTVGASAMLSQSNAVGIALTAMYGDLDVSSPDILTGNMTTAYLSTFWRYSSSAWNHTVIATAGLATTDIRRTVNYGAGSYTTNSSPNGYALGLMYEVGYSFLVNEAATACIQPVLNVAWQYAHLNSYRESGSDAALNVNAIRHHSLIFGAGARTQILVGEEVFNGAALFEARALAKVYTGDRQAEAEVGFMNSSRREVMKSYRAGAMGVELGGGLSIPLGISDSLFLDASCELRNEETNFNATLGYRFTF